MYMHSKYVGGWENDSCAFINHVAVKTRTYKDVFDVLYTHRDLEEDTQMNYVLMYDFQVNLFDQYKKRYVPTHKQDLIDIHVTSQKCMCLHSSVQTSAIWLAMFQSCIKLPR